MMLPELLTVREVAEILKVSYETALEYVKINKLAIPIGRQYRVPKDKLATHLNKGPAPALKPLKLNKGR